MRLLRCSLSAEGILEVELEEYLGDVPPYIALSHRWGPPHEEVTFADMNGSDLSYQRKAGWSKIRECCSKALELGVHHVWVDTCCIDKSSSSELSEAINSMFRYYKKSTICFAFLNDVDLREGSHRLEQSLWFSRAWTLQELIAPRRLQFFDAEWQSIGLRSDAYITNQIFLHHRIPKALLARKGTSRLHLRDYSVAERMSWAAGRKAARIEDRAYSLFGISEVNLPLLYGESKRAFVRLQKEIIRENFDPSILMWDEAHPGNFAKTTESFNNNAVMEGASYESAGLYLGLLYPMKLDPSFSVDNVGLKIQMPIWKTSKTTPKGYPIYYAALNYGNDQHMAVIYLHSAEVSDSFVCPVFYRTSVDGHSSVWLSENSLDLKWKVLTIYIIT